MQLHKQRSFARPVYFFVFIFILSACNAGYSTPYTIISGDTYRSAGILVRTATPFQPSYKPVEPSPTSTATSLPTATPTITPSSTLTPTATLTSTPNPEPMSIQASRARAYPGSDIVIEKELPPGSNYHRYYAWYLSDGLKIYALLTVPDGTRPEGGWPAIVFNHGFIEPDLYSTTSSYAAHVDSLARHGYVVFKIDYRGNDKSEGPGSYVYGETGYTDDVLNALSSLERFDQVNPQKIGMWGHSMGGFLTLRAMVISKDIKAGVIWAGVVGSYADMICCWEAHPMVFPIPYVGMHTGWQSWIQEHGSPDKKSPFWDTISATSYVADLSGPLQLQHDISDTEVPYAFSEKLAADIQDAGKTVEFYSYAGNDHNLSTWYSLAMNRTIQFFDKYLK